MPTANPRLMLTLTPDQYDLLSRLARVQGRSRAAVVMELLETVVPVFERVVVAAEAAQRAQVQATEGLRDSVQAAEAAILPHVSAAMGQLDLLVEEAVRSAGASPGPRKGTRRLAGAGGTIGPSRPHGRSGSPRPVTRGPGRGAKTRGGRSTKGGRR